MPALTHLHNLPARAVRAAAGLAGIVLLLLQTFGPALASPGESVWVEICSEGGAVWVEVDLEEDAEDPTAYCPKCADCALCAITDAAPMPDLVQLARSDHARIMRFEYRETEKPHSTYWLWPETRGPPCAAQIKTERAPRASMASTQNTGGAPWS